MEWEHMLAAAMIAGVFFGTHLAAEVICGKEPPIKPTRCVCGTLIDGTGGAASGVVVRVLRRGMEVATAETGPDGRFAFPGLRAGDYALEAKADGFRTFRSPVVVVGRGKKCRSKLTILLAVGGLESCGSYVMKQ